MSEVLLCCAVHSRASVAVVGRRERLIVEPRSAGLGARRQSAARYRAYLPRCSSIIRNRQMTTPSSVSTGNACLHEFGEGGVY